MDSGNMIIIIMLLAGYFIFVRYVKLLHEEFKILYKKIDKLKIEREE